MRNSFLVNNILRDKDSEIWDFRFGISDFGNKEKDLRFF